MFHNKNLLVISDRYPHAKDSFSGVFVHSQIEELKKYFKNIMVISLTPYTPQILKRVLQPRRAMDSLAEDYTYENVEVHFAKHIVFPFEPLKRYRVNSAYKSVMAILRKTGFKPDILHAHFIWPSGYVGMSISKKFEIPFVLTAHGHDVYDIPFRNKFYNGITKKILKNADFTITTSKRNRDILANKLGCPSKKIGIIYNGYDSELFHPVGKVMARKKLSIPVNKKIILNVANLNPIKGHKYVIKAMKKIVKNLPDAECYIVGQGTEKARLKKEIEELGLENNVFLVGPKEHEKIPLWMNAADIFVLPSVDEGNPTVMFEVLGCGKPFIGTIVGGIPEIIRNERLGILVPPKNPDALAEAIIKGLKRKWDADYILKYAEQFTWKNIAKQIIDIYSTLIASSEKRV